MKRNQRGSVVVWIVAFLVAAVAASLFVMLRRPAAGKPFVLSGKNFGNAPQIYLKHCASCHGEEGFGDGKAAYLLHPRPRDFSYGKFILVSTDNRVPSDEDLLRTITRGLPGSAMAPWGHLPEQDRRSLVRYLRALARAGKMKRLMGLKGGPEAAQPLSQKAAEELAIYLFEVGKPLPLPPETPVSESTLQRGRKIYVDTCAKCHGQRGKGDGPQNMEDDLGFRAYPRDFTKGIFKGSPEAKELAYRILGGMPSTPMPSSELKTGEDLWAIVHYVQSLILPGAQERVTQRRQIIHVQKVGEVPGEPADARWDAVPATYIALMPLWWRDERVEGVEVRAVHDGGNLAIQVAWRDASENLEQAHVNSFGDAAAMQFSTDKDPPFFGMGDGAAPVNIWLWKAAWERDLLTRDNPPLPYPRAMMDFDISVKRPGPSSAATGASKVEERDPKFYAGWGAGNLIANPHRPASVENLNAKGFGTLQARAALAQSVRGKGVWSRGAWRVMFVRSLAAPGKGDVEFRPGQNVQVGFAVWDGQAGDRNGQKSVTIWHDLALGR
jgi:mono/diheme cytochrome c family protein